VTGRQPRLLPAGAVAEPAGEPNTGSVWVGAASTGSDSTERAAMRKNEEGEKHDGVLRTRA